MTTETIYAPPVRMRLRPKPSSTVLDTMVFENEDLLSLILQRAELAPREFVWASRVCKGWHAACFRDGELALQAARHAHCLTKRALMGLLALNSSEADRLPRATHARRGGGVMYAYPIAVVNEAWEGIVGGVDAWRSRLAERAREQHSIEKVFGSEWRDIRWPKRQKTWDPYAVCAVY
jgi:hypothetical protein|eukprot:2922149-Prymnesium_polylepis.1